MEYVVIGIVIGAGIGAAIGQSKGRVAGGALLGAVLGPLGWILVAVGPSMGRKCPACLGSVPAGATACMRCGRSLVEDTIGTAGY